MKTAAKNTNNMTVGSPLRIILLFAIPILVGCFFQQLYNVVDTAVVGHCLGDNALAAIGATTAIYNLIIGFSNGLTNGFSVVIAKMFGADNAAGIRRSVTLTYLLTICISAVLTSVSMFGINPLLRFLNTPDDIFADASAYLTIILMFSGITMFYNMFAGMLRAVGNSRVPLISLICSTVVNIVLDIFFIGYLDMGIAGAAYATVIAQAVSAVICFGYIYMMCPLLRMKRKHIHFDRPLLADLISTGVSMGLMLGVVAIGSVALQSAVNSFGSRTITAHTAGRKLDTLFMMPLSAVSTAASTFAGQNYGAGKFDRVSKGIKVSVAITYVWNIFALAVSALFGKQLIAALTGTSDAEIIDTAFRYLILNVPFFFVLSILLVLRSSLQGIGRKLAPLSASIVELAAKFLAVGIITPALGYFGICILEPAIWIICTLIVVTDFSFACRKNTKTNRILGAHTLKRSHAVS